MGKKVSKRLLSLFLSVLMLATSLPFAGLSASAADESSNLPKSTSGAYLFAYFRNDAKSTNGENIFYAVSKDGYNYEALNGGVPVASASQGTGHSRDPYIMKAQRLQLSQLVQPQLLRRIKARTAKNSAVPMAASSRMSQIFTAALRSRGTQRQPPTQSNTATAPVRQPTCRPVPAARRPPPPRRGCTAG